ncbi:MAG TPA: NAD(P)-binding domain-containing protein [Firmicutes bacterium]|nr:NAD(P)-binding domain-containing protein [Bacillota bacterium]
MKIAIIGAGTMGSLLAERLAAPGRELLLVDRNPLKAYQIAQQAGCSAGTLEMTAGVDVVILALPAAAVLPVAKQLRSYLGEGTLLVNIATSAPTEPLRHELAGTGVKVAGVRFIGHAQETRRGEIPILAVATDDEGVFPLLSEIFRRLGPVVRGEDDLALRINTLATRAGVRAALALEKELAALGIEGDYLHTAIVNVAAGALKACARGELGEFARQLAAREEEK